MRKFLVYLGLALVSITVVATAAQAAGNKAPEAMDWQHNGPFGTYDRSAAQRGFFVYKEVCASCHAMKYIAFRNLTALGFTVKQVKSLAKEVEIVDGPNDEGDMVERPGKPSDYFPAPFDNDNAARASNNGALPPDLSLIVKARLGHEDYIYAILTGFSEAPSGVKLGENMNYNPYFTGSQIAMAPPLDDGAVEYADGTKATTAQMAHDVTVFLAWAAEPHLEARKSMGVKVMIFLFLFACLMYAVKRKVWADVH